MFFMLKKKRIYLVYVLKHNSNREKQVNLLMILNGEGWHYIAVKTLPALLRIKTSKNHGDFYCLNCLRYFRTEKELESHKKYLKIKIYI